MHVEEHEPIEQLRRLVRAERDPRVARRLQAVVLARGGRTAPQVAEATGLSRRPVQSWVARYNVEGVEGLRDRPRSGKPPRLTATQQDQLRAKLDAGADYEQDGVCTLRGVDVRRFIEERFGVVYHLGHVYKLLAKLGYSSLVPRPRHRKSDPGQQAHWRDERAPLFSGKSRSVAPTSG